MEDREDNASKAAMGDLDDSESEEAKTKMGDIVVRKYLVSKPIRAASSVLLVLTAGAAIAALGFVAVCRRRHSYTVPEDNALDIELCEAGRCDDALE